MNSLYSTNLDTHLLQMISCESLESFVEETLTSSSPIKVWIFLLFVLVVLFLYVVVLENFSVFVGFSWIKQLSIHLGTHQLTLMEQPWWKSGRSILSLPYSSSCVCHSYNSALMAFIFTKNQKLWGGVWILPHHLFNILFWNTSKLHWNIHKCTQSSSNCTVQGDEGTSMWFPYLQEFNFYTRKIILRKISFSCTCSSSKSLYITQVQFWFLHSEIKPLAII